MKKYTVYVYNSYGDEIGSYENCSQVAGSMIATSLPNGLILTKFVDKEGYLIEILGNYIIHVTEEQPVFRAGSTQSTGSD